MKWSKAAEKNLKPRYNEKTRNLFFQDFKTIISNDINHLVITKQRLLYLRIL